MPKKQLKKIFWWKDKKLLAGVAIVVISLVLGLYGKGLVGIFVIDLLKKLYSPVYLLTGLSVYALSWILLFFGMFLVGWETVKIIRNRIHHHVKKTVKDTYHYTKELHKKSMRQINKTSKAITQKNKAIK